VALPTDMLTFTLTIAWNQLCLLIATRYSYWHGGNLVCPGNDTDTPRPFRASRFRTAVAGGVATIATARKTRNLVGRVSQSERIKCLGLV
jgi:hypothetical protein